MDEHGNYKTIVQGKCCQCGKPLKENEGLFLCDNCKILNERYYEEQNNQGGDKE